MSHDTAADTATDHIPFGVRALMVAQFLVTLSVIGQLTVLGKEVYDLTRSEFNLGLLGLAEFLPTALLAPIAGSVADRVDRRTLVRVGLVVEAVSSLGLFLFVRSDSGAVWPIFALVAGFGVARAFVSPAQRALLVDAAPRDVVERVVATNAVVWQAAIIGGPVVFTLLFKAGHAVPYVIAAALFVTASLVVSLVPPTGVARRQVAVSPREGVRQAFEGLRFIRSQPVLLGAISLDLFAVLFGGAVALLPAIAEDRLGVGAVGLGWLRASAGAGAALMGIYLTRRPIVRRLGRVLLSVVAVFGLATIVLGVTGNYAVAVGALVSLSAADAVSVYIRSTLVPLATPEEMRGRVLAVENVFIGASNELGAFESGVAAFFLGLVGAVVSGGIATLGVVAFCAWRFPELRGVDRFDDVRPASARGPRSGPALQS
jgi:MFS family permease